MRSIEGSSNGTGKPTREIQMDHHLNAIENYWESLRNNRCVPARAEVDPRNMQHALNQAFILERMAPGMARIRVAGHLLSDLLGVEVRGMPFSSLIAPESRDAFREVLENVFRGPAKATLQFTSDKGFARPTLSATMILLPLSGHRGDVSRVLGGVSLHGDIGNRPRRLTLGGSFLRQLKRPMAAGDTLANNQSLATKVPYLRVVAS